MVRKSKMKNLIIILFLIINFQNLAKANEINELEIEGLSIGESLLNYYTENEIKKKLNYPSYKTKKYNIFEDYNPEKFKIYDSIQVAFQNSDKSYKIYGISGLIFFDNINDCYKKKQTIVEQLTELFPNARVNSHEPTTHSKKFSNSTYDGHYFNFVTKDYIGVSCYDWDTSTGFSDNLRISMNTWDYEKFLRNVFN